MKITITDDDGNVFAVIHRDRRTRCWNDVGDGHTIAPDDVSMVGRQALTEMADLINGATMWEQELR